MKVRDLVRNDAKDGVKWRAHYGEQKANSHKSGKNGLKIFVVIVVVLFSRKMTYFSGYILKSITSKSHT